MKNEELIAAYLEGVSCGEVLLHRIAEEYISNLDWFEEEDAEVLNDNLLNYGKSIGFLAHDMGIRFLKVMKEFFLALDMDVPKSVKKIRKSGNEAAKKEYLCGFGLIIKEVMQDWEGFLQKTGHIDYDEKSDSFNIVAFPFDPEQVQQVLFDLERSGE